VEDLRTWAVIERLPWLVEALGLTAGAICGSLEEALRRQVYGLGSADELPAPIDWERNGIIISPPGTGKGMACFVEALLHYERVYVLVPSVIQAHKLEESLDVLFHRDLGGCATSQRKARGLIRVITTGIFHQLVADEDSQLWEDGTVLIVDEAQRILENDPETELMIGTCASQGVPVMIVSATIAPGTLPEVYGHGASEPAQVYSLVKNMHPVEIEVTTGREITQVLSETEELLADGKTTLVFCASRREVASVADLLAQLGGATVRVTGAHQVEEQIAEIESAQATGLPVFVVATPGTMDSSVTVPGLSCVVIQDMRYSVDWNKFGVIERRHETLPVNHIVQMIRRVGRIARTDGQRDKVIVVSSCPRPELMVETPQFQPISGCSPHTQIENLLLRAVQFDIPFADVHDYMVSNFAEERIEKTVAALLEHGMIERVDDPSDPDGFELTDKGELVISLPFEYRWSRLIVEAPEELQLWLTLAAACGHVRDLEMHEEQSLDVAGHQRSEVLRKIALMVEYLGLEHDREQRDEADERGLSFRRMEQAETLFDLAMEALELDWDVDELAVPEGEEMETLLLEIVTGGLRTGLYKLYFPHRGDRGGWSEPRPTPDLDGQFRRFFVDDNGLALSRYAEGGVCAVVASPTWFTSKNGGPCANLDDVTIVPSDLLPQLVADLAKREGWFQVTFEEGEFRGQTRLEARGADGWTIYLPSRMDNEPEVGVAYWCSPDRQIGRGIQTVWIHFPVNG